MVVIVHGSQDHNATATVLWDNAFAEPVSPQSTLTSRLQESPPVSSNPSRPLPMVPPSHPQSDQNKVR